MHVQVQLALDSIAALRERAEGLLSEAREAAALLRDAKTAVRKCSYSVMAVRAMLTAGVEDDDSSFDEQEQCRIALRVVTQLERRMSND